MASRIRIAIDCMGGDFGPRVSVPAAVQAISQFPTIEIILVGDKQTIESRLPPSALAKINTENAGLSIVHASDIVSMSDTPSTALRHKPLSSMRIAVNHLNEKKVDAVVSAGNTGALLAIGCYVLKTLPGIDRPAICSPIPSGDKHCYLLDLGANVDSKAEHLHQFAIMGSALSSVIDNVESPAVALLNIGEENSKGNEQVKLAGSLIAANSQINYIGSIEGHSLFEGKADVVVCDGFVGNVALKVSEGTASFISSIIKAEFRGSLVSRLIAYLAKPVLTRVFEKLNPQSYSGASFLGLQGVLVKSHGNSTVEGFVQAISHAKSEVESNILELISHKLKQQREVEE